METLQNSLSTKRKCPTQDLRESDLLCLLFKAELIVRLQEDGEGPC